MHHGKRVEAGIGQAALGSIPPGTPPNCQVTGAAGGVVVPGGAGVLGGLPPGALSALPVAGGTGELGAAGCISTKEVSSYM